jgi:hypothetical protein
MLDEDPLSGGQREDLVYIMDVLDSLRSFARTQYSSENEHVDDAGVDLVLQSTNLDATTKAWLQGFTHSTSRGASLRKVVKGIMFMDRLKTKTRNVSETEESPRTTWDGTVGRELKKLQSWDEFNIFDLSAVCKTPLAAIAETSFEARGLLKRFSVRASKFRNFFSAIENGYLANPYHNALHGADILQTVHVMLMGEAMQRSFSEIEVLVALFAAACHDVGHPGVTNDFRVGRRDEGAITYNDVSVNENMHCAITYKALQTESCNWQEGMSQEQTALIRKGFIDIVLATDMAFHFKNLSAMQGHIEAKGRDITTWEQKAPALEMLVHAADISNVTKAIPVALQWADRILEEFFAQGDLERDAGAPISPLCDRNTVSKAKSQIGFCDFIVRPTFQTLGMFCTIGPAIENLNKYHGHWSSMQEKEQGNAAPVS